MNAAERQDREHRAPLEALVPPRALTYRILPLALASVLVLLLIPAGFERLLLPSIIDPAAPQQDYWAFFAGANAALGGLPANPYDPSAFQDYIGAPSTLLWLYPPTMLMLVAPFGLLSYGTAKILWILSTTVAAAFVAWIATGRLAILPVVILSPVVWVCLFVGQLGTVFGLWLVAGIAFARTRPVLSGVCFALLTVKPQYGLMVVPFLLAARAWKALGVSFALGLLLHLASVVAFGFRSWSWFFMSLSEGAHTSFLQSTGHPGRITFRDATGAVGFSGSEAWLSSVALLGIAIVGLFLLARRARFDLLVAFVLAAAGCVAPYFFVYDYIILYAAILIIAVHVPRIPAASGLVMSVVWFAPLVPIFVGSPLNSALLWFLNALCASAIFHLGWTNAGADRGRSDLGAP